MNSRISCASALFLSTAISCTPTGKMDVQRQYISDVRTLNITPVYPPSEAFQLGDVFLVMKLHRDPGAPPAVDESESEQIKITNLAVLRGYAERALQGRVDFADTTLAGTTKDATIGQTDLTLGQVGSIGNKGKAMALPSVAFPKVSADAGSVYGWAPAGFLGLNLGGSNRTTVTLDFKDVRTFAASKVQAAGEIGRHLAPGRIGQSCQTAVRLMTDRLREKLAGKGKGPGKVIRVDIEYTVVTQLFLTRQIDYSYSSKAIFAAANNAAPKTGTASYGPTVVVGTAEGAGATDLATTLAALQMQNTTGFSAGTFDERGITLTRTFQKPVTVGYDSLTYGFCQPAATDGTGTQGFCAKGQQRAVEVPLDQALAGAFCAYPVELFPANPSPAQQGSGIGFQRVAPSL